MDDPAIPAFACATLTLIAGALTAFGLRRERMSGWRGWVAAIALVALGCGIAAASPDAVGAAVAGPLLLQWPLLALLAMRRFHARHRWPLSAGIDLIVLALTGTGAVAGPLAGGSGGAWLTAASSLAAHLYAVALLFMGPGGRAATPLQALAAAIALAGFGPGLAGLPTPADLPLRACAATLGAVVLAFVVLTLATERTERRLRDSQQRLRTLANLDALTQIPNRRRFTELAQRALRSTEVGGGGRHTAAMVLLIDIDHFKQINDHLGHAAGDRALRLVASSMIEHLRGADLAGRHGGDEFVLLLRCAGTDEAVGIADRIVGAIQSRCAEHQLPRLGLSFGLAHVEGAADLDAALQRADQALYEAKRQGRGCAVAEIGGGESAASFSASRPLGLTAC
ncbi:MAG: GGDEF domain-containing protein [Burkholderiales bacterium]|nr:GGDEF domain-containing protein [Burkholderiales bacterium]